MPPELSDYEKQRLANIARKQKPAARNDPCSGTRDPLVFRRAFRFSRHMSIIVNEEGMDAARCAPTTCGSGAGVSGPCTRQDGSHSASHLLQLSTLKESGLLNLATSYCETRGARAESKLAVKSCLRPQEKASCQSSSADASQGA